jgi:hypothetical protein
VAVVEQPLRARAMKRKPRTPKSNVCFMAG